MTTRWLIWLPFLVLGCTAPQDGLFGADDTADPGQGGGGAAVAPLPDAGSPQGDAGGADVQTVPDSAPADAGDACTPPTLATGQRYVDNLGQPCDPCARQCIIAECGACTVAGIPAAQGAPYMCDGPTPDQPATQCLQPQWCSSWGAAGSSCGTCYNFTCQCFQQGCARVHPSEI